MITGGKHDPDTLVTTMMPVDTIKIGERIGRGLGDLPSLTADFAIEPIGRRYEKAMAEWLVANSFKEIDKGTRSRLLDCLEHRTEIEAWRSVLTGSERFRFNHPNTLWRKWRAATTVPDPNAKPRTSPVARDGGDLTKTAGSSNDIATADGKPSTPTQPEEDDPKRSKDFRCCDIAAAGYAVGRPSEI